MKGNTPTHEEIIRHLTIKATKDDSFRQSLLTNATATVATELAAAFPALGSIPRNIKVTAVEQSASHVYLVLPPKASIAKADELDDAELEAVAGGYVSFSGCWDNGSTSNSC